MSGSEPTDSVQYWTQRLNTLDALRSALLASGKHLDQYALQDISIQSVNAQRQINLLLGQPPTSGV
jgi:hypothetical protein